MYLLLINTLPTGFNVMDPLPVLRVRPVAPTTLAVNTLPPVMLPVAEINPPVKMLPCMALPVELI